MTAINLLDTLPPEIHIGLIHHISTDRQSIFSLSQCNHYWRARCISALFSRVTLGDGPNMILKQFVTEMAPSRGRFIKDLHLHFINGEPYYQQDIRDSKPEYDPSNAVNKWIDQRNELLQELFTFMTHLTHISLAIHLPVMTKRQLPKYSPLSHPLLPHPRSRAFA